MIQELRQNCGISLSSTNDTQFFAIVYKAVIGRPNWASFVKFLLLRNNILQENCRLKRYLNSDHQSRRQVFWRLDRPQLSGTLGRGTAGHFYVERLPAYRDRHKPQKYSFMKNWYESGGIVPFYFVKFKQSKLWNILQLAS